jgi:hypothetical protein
VVLFTNSVTDFDSDYTDDFATIIGSSVIAHNATATAAVIAAAYTGSSKRRGVDSLSIAAAGVFGLRETCYYC